MEEVKIKVITECKSCKCKNLVQQKNDIISEEDIESFVELDTLVCTNCGTIHDPEGKWTQHNFKINKLGYSKTLTISDNVKNWN